MMSKVVWPCRSFRAGPKLQWRQPRTDTALWKGNVAAGIGPNANTQPTRSTSSDCSMIFSSAGFFFKWAWHNDPNQLYRAPEARALPRATTQW